MNPERREFDQDRLQYAADRVAYVMDQYLRDHPGDALGEEVATGALSVERAYRILKETGGRDPKTGVDRSDLFHYALDFEMEQSRARERPMSLGIIDIDNFKAINEQFGHDVGDVVLRKVAECISDCVRASDDALPVAIPETPSRGKKHTPNVVRWGGEEFMVMLSSAGLDAGHSVLDRIRQHVEEMVITPDESGAPEPIRVTVTGGVAEYSSSAPVTQAELIRLADQRLRAGKQRGKNTVVSVETQAPSVGAA